MKLLKIIINRANRGLCFDLSVQNFVCLFVSQLRPLAFADCQEIYLTCKVGVLFM